MRYEPSLILVDVRRFTIFVNIQSVFCLGVFYLVGDMKSLIINAHELLCALRAEQTDSYLDYETGEINTMSFYSNLPLHEWKKYVDGMANNPERYLLITPLSMAVWKQITNNFLDTLPAYGTTIKVRRFLESDLWLERITEVLKTDHEFGEKFRDYHEHALMQLARQWLEEQKIEAELSW